MDVEKKWWKNMIILCNYDGCRPAFIYPTSSYSMRTYLWIKLLFIARTLWTQRSLFRYNHDRWSALRLCRFDLFVWKFSLRVNETKEKTPNKFWSKRRPDLKRSAYDFTIQQLPMYIQMHLFCRLSLAFALCKLFEYFSYWFGTSSNEITNSVTFA